MREGEAELLGVWDGEGLEELLEVVELLGVWDAVTELLVDEVLDSDCEDVGLLVAVVLDVNDTEDVGVRVGELVGLDEEELLEDELGV